jgi:hypothetical protein
MTPFPHLRLDHNNQALIKGMFIKVREATFGFCEKPKSQATRLKYTNGVMTSRVGRTTNQPFWDALKACACPRKLTLLASSLGAKFP